jgi:hypothetical protein
MPEDAGSFLPFPFRQVGFQRLLFQRALHASASALSLSHILLDTAFVTPHVVPGPLEQLKAPLGQTFPLAQLLGALLEAKSEKGPFAASLPA